MENATLPSIAFPLHYHIPSLVIERANAVMDIDMRLFMQKEVLLDFLFFYLGGNRKPDKSALGCLFPFLFFSVGNHGDWTVGLRGGGVVFPGGGGRDLPKGPVGSHSLGTLFLLTNKQTKPESRGKEKRKVML